MIIQDSFQLIITAFLYMLYKNTMISNVTKKAGTLHLGFWAVNVIAMVNNGMHLS